MPPLLKELRNYKRKLFCVRHNNRRNHNQRFKLLFFKENLHFGTSGQISTYGKLNLLPIKSIYLIFPSRERQRRLIQTKVYYKLFYTIWKETSHKPLKVGAAKKSFPSVYIIDKTCFDECFLFHVITGRHYFLHKFSVTRRFGAIAMLLLSLKHVFWKRSTFYVRFLQNNTSMLLILKVQDKSSTSQIFSKKIFVDSVSFTFFHFVNIHIFLYKWNF